MSGVHHAVLSSDERQASGAPSIALTQTTTGFFGDGVTSFNASITTAVGKLLVLLVSQENTGTSATQSPAITTPSGWTIAKANAGALSGGGAVTGLNSQGIFYKLAASTSESATITSPNSSWSAAVIGEYTFTGTLALDATNHTEGSATGTSISAGSVTPSSAVSLIVACASATGVGAMSALAGPTSGYTQLLLVADNNTHTDHASGSKILSSASAQNAGFTWSGASYNAAAIASFIVT